MHHRSMVVDSSFELINEQLESVLPLLRPSARSRNGYVPAIILVWNDLQLEAIFKMWLP